MAAVGARRASPLRSALLVLSVLILDASSAGRASAARACVWIVESVQDDGDHKFDLNLSVDAPRSVAVRFQGPNFTSGSMGGEMIPLDAGEPKVVESDGLDVSAGDDLSFDVQLFDRPLASLEEMEHPTRRPLATFTFHRKVGEDEHTPPPALAVNQCKPMA